MEQLHAGGAASQGIVHIQPRFSQMHTGDFPGERTPEDHVHGQMGDNFLLMEPAFAAPYIHGVRNRLYGRFGNRLRMKQHRNARQYG